MVLLDDLWTSELTQDQDLCQKWLHIVKESYDRPCSDLKYLEFKLGQYSWCREKLTSPNAVFLAIVFQTIHYDIKSMEFIDQCISRFKEFSNELSIDQKVRDEVINLIELSKLSSTDEHKVANTFGETDQHFFLDINFAMFGSSWEDYSKFCDKNRREYDFLDEGGYKTLRRKVLQSFIQIPNIFATKEFREKFEAKARENLKKEIESLK